MLNVSIKNLSLKCRGTSGVGTCDAGSPSDHIQDSVAITFAMRNYKCFNTIRGSEPTRKREPPLRLYVIPF